MYRINRHIIIVAIIISLCTFNLFAQKDVSDTFCGHKVLLDNSQKILPRKVAAENAYDHFLRLRWNFIKTKVPNSPGPAPRSSYPQYYFYCAFIDSNNILLPDMWMNDVGEKIPMWFESARLYYAYTGDATGIVSLK